MLHWPWFIRRQTPSARPALAEHAFEIAYADVLHIPSEKLEPAQLTASAVSLSIGLIAVGICEAITVILEQTSWPWVLPGVATILAMLCINSVGDGLLDATDPRGLLASKTQTGRRSPTGGGGLRAAPRAHRPVKSREEVQTS